MLEELLKAGADINGTTTTLATPLMMALWKKKVPVVKLLLGGSGDRDMLIAPRYRGGVDCSSTCAVYVRLPVLPWMAHAAATSCLLTLYRPPRTSGM